MNKEMKINPGYKKTSVGIIPEDWEVKRFEKITINKGLIRGPFGSALKKEFFVSDGYKVYEQQNAIHKTYNRGNYFVDHSKFKELIRFAVKEDDFIMSCSGTIGELYKIPKNHPRGIINQALLLIRLDDKKISHTYFENIFQTSIIKNRILESQGGAIKNLVGMNQIRKLRIPIPPLPEQKAIADCLSTWDRGIEKLTALINAKKEQKKGLMQQIFNGQLTMVVPGDEDNEKLAKGDFYLRKTKPGEDGTAHWKKIKIEKFAKEYNKRNSDNRNIEVLSCTKYDGLVPSLKYFGRKVYGDDLSKYKKVPFGYFAYATNHIEEGSLGYQNIKSVGLVSPMYTVFKTSENINDSFLFMLLKSHNLIHEYNRRMEGSINRRGGLRWNNFKKIKIKLPPLEEQTAIAEVLTTADREIELLEKKLEAMKEQKKGLMQVLLTGEKRLITEDNN